MTIKITTRKTNPMRVLLAERHRLHPGGSVFIASDGRTYEVGETPSVRNLFSMADKQGNDLVRKGTRAFAGAGADDEVDEVDAAMRDDLTGAVEGDSGGENPPVEQGGDPVGVTPDPKEVEAAQKEAQKAAGQRRR